MGLLGNSNIRISWSWHWPAFLNQHILELPNTYIHIYIYILCIIFCFNSYLGYLWVRILFVSDSCMFKYLSWNHQADEVGSTKNIVYHRFPIRLPHIGGQRPMFRYTTDIPWYSHRYPMKSPWLQYSGCSLGVGVTGFLSRKSARNNVEEPVYFQGMAESIPMKYHYILLRVRFPWNDDSISTVFSGCNGSKPMDPTMGPSAPRSTSSSARPSRLAICDSLPLPPMGGACPG